MTERSFPTHRAAALALLSGDKRLTRKEGQFLGQLAADPTPLSHAQAAWLGKLLDRAGLPPLAEGGALWAPIRTRRAIAGSKHPLPPQRTLRPSWGGYSGWQRPRSVTLAPVD